MEFAEVREYQPVDEVRSIDWNVTARMRRPFVKRYIEERELTLMLVVDVSGSEQFGTHRRFKSEMATELAAVLTMSAVRNNDRVGALLFTDRVEHFVPPRKGRRHALRILRDVLAHEPVGRGTDIGGALNFLRQLLRQHAIIFLISDLADAAVERPLKLLAQRHDVVVAPLDDPSELSLPDMGLARFVDAESGETIDVDTSDPKVRKAFEAPRDGARRNAPDVASARDRRDSHHHARELHRAAAAIFPGARAARGAHMKRLACVGAFVLASTAGAQQGSIQRGVVVQPESVTVGDPFRVVIRVRAPLGSVIEFPAAPDSSEKVEPLDRVVVAPGTDSTAVEQTATWRLAAWDVGRRMLRFPDILVRQGNQVRRLEVGRDLSVEVSGPARGFHPARAEAGTCRLYLWSSLVVVAPRGAGRGGGRHLVLVVVAPAWRRSRCPARPIR
jgi:hypothetical protein